MFSVKESPPAAPRPSAVEAPAEGDKLNTSTERSKTWDTPVEPGLVAGDP